MKQHTELVCGQMSFFKVLHTGNIQMANLSGISFKWKSADINVQTKDFPGMSCNCKLVVVYKRDQQYNESCEINSFDLFSNIV